MSVEIRRNWRRTHGSITVGDYFRDRWGWQIHLSTGLQAFSLGVVVRCDRPWTLAIGLIVILFEIEVWP